MMDNNYAYSQELLHHCLEHGNALHLCLVGSGLRCRSKQFSEDPAIRKSAQRLWLFEAAVRPLCAAHGRRIRDSQVVGLRYFNVYGPREQHKGSDGECRVSF